MIIIMKREATEADIRQVVRRLGDKGYGTHVSEGVEKTIIGAIGVHNDEKALLAEQLEAITAVEKVVPILKPFRLAGREFQPENTIIKVGDVTIGGDAVVISAGPCAVENQEQLLETARAIKAAGAGILRGGAFKPRTSPYAFQGLEEEGLKILAAARQETGLPIVTEIMDPRSVDLVMEYSDMLQIGARNMQNFFLLREVGKSKKPVLLKRGLSATIEELLMAAEYIMSEGNTSVILCERGIRTFEPYTRNTLDLSAVPLIRELSHLPVWVDPSHGTGHWRLVAPMARAAIAAGADGLMIEVHPRPGEALSDGSQSLTYANFVKLMAEIKPIAEILGRRV